MYNPTLPGPLPGHKMVTKTRKQKEAKSFRHNLSG